MGLLGFDFLLGHRHHVKARKLSQILVSCRWIGHGRGCWILDGMLVPLVRAHRHRLVEGAAPGIARRGA